MPPHNRANNVNNSASHDTLAEGAEALPKQTTCENLEILAMKLKAAVALRNRIGRRDKLGQLRMCELECRAWQGWTSRLCGKQGC